MNMFRHYQTGNLDKQFLRVCATHKLLDRGVIDKDRAIELLKERNVPEAKAVVELWVKYPRHRFAA